MGACVVRQCVTLVSNVAWQAEAPPVASERVRGLLVRQDFNQILVAPQYVHCCGVG